MEAQNPSFGLDKISSQNRLDFAEKAFTVFSLLFFMGVFGFGPDDSETGVIPSSIITLIRYSTYAVTLLLLAFRINNTLKTALSNKWVLCLVFFISISFLWSQDPSTTVNVVWKELIPMFLLSLYMASRFTIEQQFSLAIQALLIAFFFSILLAVAMPSIGIHQTGAYAGSLRGAFGDKNRFGATAATLLVTLFMLTNYAEKKQRWTFALLIFCFAILMISSSLTALVLSVVSLLLVSLYQKFRWIGKKSVLLVNLSTLFSISFFYVIVSSWIEILTFFGRDPTLSARTLIWNYVITTKIPPHPYLGYGKGAFWSSERLISGFEYAAFHIPAHSHNGFLDLILEAGLIGFALFLITWFIAYIRAIRLAYNFKKASYLWPAIFLSMMILFNLFESYLILFPNINWVLFIAIALSLSQKPFCLRASN
ncbi:O-antigen ligase family protein [Nodosilinea sp. LEGE 06152]|uniref:O-antigen ligase family protein n=1 Tax=Nodosilinea sp. LEGE 06152 TaxID=2777966 RepID=UPI0018826108|nr:O-antigen ligase family protein [Nodosilinea sp. LEGE 06152]MBE9157554.1 O-antigen ligase family protein [Nodosilinea sp. LEGE 06152]